MFDSRLEYSDNAESILYFLRNSNLINDKPTIEIMLGYLANVYDTLHLNDKIVLNQELFNASSFLKSLYIRELQIRLFHDLYLRPPSPPPPPYIEEKPTFVNDSQNVHTSSLQTNVRQIIDTHFNVDITHQYKTVIKEIEREINIKTKSIRKTIKNITANFTALNILCHVWQKINHHPSYRFEMIRRLDEELRDMDHKCTTGIITRLINILSAYDSTIVLRLGVEDELRCIWNHKLKQAIEATRDNDEFVLELIADTKSNKYSDFLTEFRQKFYEDHIDEYRALFSNDEKLFKSMINTL